jgi:cold shock CspA family protein
VAPTDHTGTVTEFDPARGWGAVTGDDGARVEFHCTQIADGSRSIAVGTAVRYRLAPGHLGRWEAAAIAPV